MVEQRIPITSSSRSRNSCSQNHGTNTMSKSNINTATTLPSDPWTSGLRHPSTSPPSTSPSSRVATTHRVTRKKTCPANLDASSFPSEAKARRRKHKSESARFSPVRKAQPATIASPQRKQPQSASARPTGLSAKSRPGGSHQIASQQMVGRRRVDPRTYKPWPAALSRIAVHGYHLERLDQDVVALIENMIGLESKHQILVDEVAALHRHRSQS
ncbi:hypothetical protein K458DRAFT_169395 [Lentithecium fluviatile CBS 122367]|uniref:Uncharacterized protein n=1 Tax=Lentithecium fluviatile CBS 122367 TaxID=1168545 RepID=A0A6G1JC65_9PLEO|nr:hypothetical protein K458DRAFT_169395 [Lentithecium fluviatile CBS 122367]